jgi:PAS domain S-box-containing protein
MVDAATGVHEAEPAVLAIDAEGTIASANALAERVFGHTVRGLVGQPVTILIPEHLRASYLPAIRRYVSATDALPWSALRLHALHGSGDEFPVEVTFGEEAGGRREISVRPLLEWTDRLGAEQLLIGAKRDAQRTADRMRAVGGAAAGMLRARSLDDLKEIVREACGAVIPFDAFTLGLYDAGTHALSFLSTYDSGVYSPPGTVPLAGTPSERVVAERHSLVTLSASRSAAAGTLLIGTMRRSESIIRTPILSADGVLGVISVQSYTSALYTAEDVAVLEAVAAVAATALQNIQLLEEREEAQRAYDRQQAHFEQLFQSAPEGIVLLDNLDCVLRVNPEFTRMFGYTAEEAIGRPVNQLLAPEDLRGASIALTERVARGETVSIDTVRRRKDGTLLHVSILGTPIRVSGSQVAVYGIYRDITARKDAEERLVERERYFRSLIENTSDIVAVVEVDGRVRYVSPAITRVLGVSAERVRARTLHALVHEHDAAHIDAAFAASLADVRAPLAAEARFRHADGSWRLLMLTGQNLQDDPAVRGIVINLRDITEKRAQEAHLRRVERLASLGTLVGGVAHELNNPLTAIKGFAQLMLLNDQPTGDREALETIGREANRAASIVSNLRLLARRTQERAVMGPVDVNDAVRHVLKLRRYSIETSNVLLVHDLDPALTFVWADRGQVEQVVLNLVVNAEQALAGQQRDRKLTVRTRIHDDTATIEVEDNGPGIPVAELDRIFDPFWTTKSPGIGLGLGLSLVHNIVTDHRGRISVESEIGRGARFIVELPVVPTPPASCAPAEPEVEADAPTRALRILVIDDEPSIRVSLDRFLRRRGHRVDTAAAGAEALHMIERAATDPYNVIVSDLRMPGLQGEELFDLLRERDQSWERRIVFITGDAATPKAARAFAAAAVPLLHKPFDLMDLARTIDAIGNNLEATHA